MSVKKLEVEFKSIKTEFVDLKSKIDTLIQKYTNLEKKYEKCLTRKKSASFVCNKCDEECATLKDLQDHKKDHESRDYQCEECEKYFNDENQLEEHMKRKHKKFPFDDQCVYLHEDSEKCKFGKGCERKMCMYKHEECDDSDNESDDENEDANSDDE